METLAELPFTGDQVVCLSHEPGRPQRNPSGRECLGVPIEKLAQMVPHLQPRIGAVGMTSGLTADEFITAKERPCLYIERLEQRLGLFEVLCAEAFGEPVVDRREEVARFIVPPMIVQQTGEADRGAQFEAASALLACNT